MDIKNNAYLQFTFIVLGVCILSCNNSNGNNNNGNLDNEIVKQPGKMDNVVKEKIKAALENASLHKGKIDDSLQLHLSEMVYKYYSNTGFEPVWSSKEKWNPIADSLYQLIVDAKLHGLFPKDYHAKSLISLKATLDRDSLKRMDASLWARADLMFSDGFMRIIKDLNKGRLMPDSVTLSQDTVLAENFYTDHLIELIEKKDFSNMLISLQPKHVGYWELKKGIRRFVDSMDNHIYTYVTYPYKKGDEKDSVYFVKTIQKRLSESNCITITNRLPDSLQLVTAVQKYQRQKGLKADGKISSSLIKLMNVSDAERFKRIAITLDRYKLLPEKMPEKYIWVNLPGYYLKVIADDTVAFESKIICGKPDTRTPLLNSKISDMVTYPTWTVPTSIIAKSYLPKLKNNPNYLTRIGLKLVGSKGKTIDPGTINWSKYSKGIPYKIMQNSGDNNALGVFKFNFKNPYAVYLHDTNQRYLFKNSSRALSHGCVRVQEWQKLAFFIARNDSLNLKPGDTLRYTADSILNWVAAKKNYRIDVKNQIPVYFQYFSCEGKDGKIKFYDDIYGDDKILREKYFSEK